VHTGLTKVHSDGIGYLVWGVSHYPHTLLAVAGGSARDPPYLGETSWSFCAKTGLGLVRPLLVITDTDNHKYYSGWCYFKTPNHHFC